ncbi:MAG: ammonium transporter [Methylacidiphilales bacterium]|nr:ammonium transporter [Candidatus Methylacidiphilales bacterium]
MSIKIPSLVASGILMVLFCGTLQAQQSSDTASAKEVQSLQDEMRKLQRDYIDLQKSLMDSGVGPSLRSDLSRLKDLDSVQQDIVDLKKNKEDLQAAIADLKKSAAAPVVQTQPAAAPADFATKFKALLESNDGQTTAINIVWTLITGFLVMFMQCGFAMVETGFTRAKNVAHTMSMNFMVYTLAMLGYWFMGFAIQFGGTGAAGSVSTVTTLGADVPQHLNSLLGIKIGSGFWGIMGNAGYCLPPSMLSGGIFALFLFQMVFMDTTATIPTGAMAERWRFLPFCMYAVIVGAIIYPLFGCWVWGGGWLAALGKNLGLGHGHVDFAGSSVVHLCGGVLAFVGAKILGPRIGKFNRDGSSNPIPGHNIPMGIIGTFILAFGWFGFNPGSTLEGMTPQIGIIATNTMLASAGGAVAGMICTWIRFSKPDPSFMCNGMLAGLVAITAPCAFVDSWAAVVIGVVAGILVVFSAMIVEEKLKVDDPVGAISVHATNGAWGVLSLGLLANGQYGDGWNGVSGKVTGLLYGDASQFMAQVVGTTTCIVAVGGMAWLMFKAIDKVVGHRSLPADELHGLDIPEMGCLGYQADVHPESK